MKVSDRCWMPFDMGASSLMVLNERGPLLFCPVPALSELYLQSSSSSSLIRPLGIAIIQCQRKLQGYVSLQVSQPVMILTSPENGLSRYICLVLIAGVGLACQVSFISPLSKRTSVTHLATVRQNQHVGWQGSSLQYLSLLL
jgi:hypothetical protein